MAHGSPHGTTVVGWIDKTVGHLIQIRRVKYLPLSPGSDKDRERGPGGHPIFVVTE